MDASFSATLCGWNSSYGIFMCSLSSFVAHIHNSIHVCPFLPFVFPILALTTGFVSNQYIVSLICLCMECVTQDYYGIS